MNNKMMRGFFIFAGLLAAIVLLTLVIDPLQSARGKREPISYDAFTHAVRNGQVAKVQITERMMVGLYTDTAVREDDFPGDYDFQVYLPAEGFDTDMRSIAAERTGKLVSEVTVSDYGFIITYEPEPQQSIFMQLLPYLITIPSSGLCLSVADAGQLNKALSLARYPVRKITARVTFTEVAGADEERRLRDRRFPATRRNSSAGARIPRALLSPPGTGKTRCRARASRRRLRYRRISPKCTWAWAPRAHPFEQAKRSSPASCSSTRSTR